MSVLVWLLLLSGQQSSEELALESSRVYVVVYPTEVTGTGFLIRYGDEIYGVTALRDGAAPTTFAGPDGAEVQLGSRVYADAHLQVLRVELRLNDPSEPFEYSTEAASESAEELAVIGLYDIARGTRRGDSEELLEVVTEQGSRAQDIRGSPVVSLSSGAVVGIVTKADDEEKASIFSFEPLRLDGFDTLELTDEMLVGRWATSTSAMVTELELRPEGRFVATFLVSGSFVGKVSGRWELRGQKLVWRYDKDNGLVPADREDTNAILEFSRERFTLREIDGRVSVYTKR